MTELGDRLHLQINGKKDFDDKYFTYNSKGKPFFFKFYFNIL